MTRYLHNFDSDYSFGGNTFAMEIFDNKLFVGVAHCSERDQYNKSVGRDIATSYLDELKMKYREEGVECVIVNNIPNYGKITGFVVDDTIMYHIINGYNSDWLTVFPHIEVEVKNIDYMAIEGAEMKEMLVDYYNELYNNIFNMNEVVMFCE